MSAEQPYVLSIAGFDPSGGAGLLADIKTLENHQVYGLGVCTALTAQHESHFQSVYWTPLEQIFEQAELLFQKYPIQHCKIGIVENWSVLNQLLEFLNTQNSELKVVLDPVLKASSGFSFHSTLGLKELNSILGNLSLLTPNYEELKRITPDVPVKVGCQQIAEYCPILLKGGHNEEEKGTDYLFHGKECVQLEADKVLSYPKHGSGCVLSSAITANLALGGNLLEACRQGKQYTAQFLASNEGLLGYHSNMVNPQRTLENREGILKSHYPRNTNSDNYDW
ncbi:hydroxymethylpyrimidine/phosphomethylpyrimidine kinase [Xanthovirga aplysinae]|uniref:hydroxymethylpyrimidine/phosphomethylpyrimidine kinase n=1 Tax=Xanthovirga aplysinae TaxID=2529853 RepID=UPI0012BD0C5C|nr:hydroxymethylpyrimidine/phosphomethylpyrimidine kinase [Xanthovirga aplysinae]MTI33008.1 hydroxymethylpyrimidine/phosphomethylpyrimidine kinase [Xanthovirga aplysinae]